jgi:5-methylcytosine-specific restriction endonuclease McrA
MRKGEKRPDLWKARIGKCLVCGKEFRAVKDYKDKKQKYCSKECWSIRAKITNICKYCGKQIETTKGNNKKYCNIECRNNDYKRILKKEQNPAWKGGKTKESKLRKTNKQYKEWRSKVFERDNYTCQKCGKQTRTLEAHHIKEQSKYPELIYNIDNGITLCHECHKLTDNYGYKARWKAVKIK